jgi:hypothetical protein
MLGKSLLPRSLSTRIRPVQLKQSSGHDDEIDAQKGREDLEARSVSEVVPKGCRSDDQEDDRDTCANAQASRVPFEPSRLRRVNDQQQRGIGTAGGVEDLEANVGNPLDLLSAESLGFRETIEHQTCCVLDCGKWLTVRVAGRSGIDCFGECGVLSRLNDLSPTCWLAAWIEES